MKFRLAFDPRAFLEFANILQVDKDYRAESAKRTIAGRAYYASFLISRKKAQELGYPISSTPDVHRQVMEAIMSRNSGTANKLFTLREARNEADYNLMAKFSSDQCGKLLKLAELVFHEVETIR